MSLQAILTQMQTLHRAAARRQGETCDFGRFAETLADLLGGRTAIIGDDGSILAAVGFGRVVADAFRLTPGANRQLLAICEPTTLKHFTFTGTTGGHGSSSSFDLILANVTVYPIEGGGRRFGTLLVSAPKSDAGRILAHQASLLLALELACAKLAKEAADVESSGEVESALESLSFTESRAVHALLAEFEGPEQCLVVSAVADKGRVARSVMVTALRKLESAGIIETRSLGRKGTWIRIRHPLFLDQMRKVLGKT